MDVFNPHDFVTAHLVSGTAEVHIRKELTETYHFEPATARMIVEQVKRGNPEVMALRQQQFRAIRNQESRAWIWTVLGGAILCIIGILITAATYAWAEPGGTFFVAGGAIIIGMFTILKGVWHLIRRVWS